MNELANNNEINLLKSILNELSLVTSYEESKSENFIHDYLRKAFFFTKAGQLFAQAINDLVTIEEFTNGCKRIQEKVLIGSKSELLFTQYICLIKSHPEESFNIIKEALTDKNTATQARIYLNEWARYHDFGCGIKDKSEVEAQLEGVNKDVYCLNFPLISEGCASGTYAKLFRGAHDAVFNVCVPSAQDLDLRGSQQYLSDEKFNYLDSHDHQGQTYLLELVARESNLFEL